MENEKNENLSNIKKIEATEIIEATYKEMGKRSLKAIAEHILKENINEENLISDIANVDYTKNNQGKTHLQEIEGFGLFVDDLYIYGYLRKEDIVFTPKGGVSCTEGGNGSASCIVEMLRSIVKQTIGKNSNLPHINITHTVEIKNSGNSSILKTILEIEKNHPVRQKWEERTLNHPFAVFVVKVDVSNIPIQELQKYIKELEQALFTIGYYIYCVDYTRDFSGTMDKEELVKYLIEEEDFKEEGNTSNMEKTNIVLKNNSSVGCNVLTYIRRDGENLLRTKVYNKIVSNLEAGEVRSNFGGHIYDYVYSSNDRLRRLFWHPDTKKRGITRIEVSLYGRQYRLSENIGGWLVSRELKLISKKEMLFYIQPAKNQWLALAENIKQCFILVDRPHSLAYMAWYGSSLTGRIAGVKIDYIKKRDKEDIENLILWAISDFGFKKIPIYRADILEYTSEKIRISPLKCYVKDSESTTILTPCNKPGKFTEDVLNIDIEDYLTSTEFIKWEWRNHKLASSNDRKPTGEILEMPNLAENKKISLLSLAEREKRNLEIEEARKKTEWIHRTGKILNGHVEKIKFISAKLEELKRRKEKEKQAFNLVYSKIQNLTCRKIKEEDAGKYYVLGWQPCTFNNMVLIVDTADIEKYLLVFANTRIEKILKYFTPSFLQRKIKKNVVINFYKPIYDDYTNYFILEIGQKQRFLKNGQWLEYFPVSIDPREEELKQEIVKILKEEEDINEKTENLFLEEIQEPNKAKNADHCVDIEEGEFKILSYSRSIFRGNPKTFLYLEKSNQPENKYLVWGHWIEEEIKKIEENKKLNHIAKPVFCRLGMVKTTPNKKKARTCTICYN